MKEALCWESVVAIIFALILGISYSLSNTSAIPVTVITGQSLSDLNGTNIFNYNTRDGTYNITRFRNITETEIDDAMLSFNQAIEDKINVDLSFSQFLPAILVFIG